jgi:hypothetical protein
MRRGAILIPRRTLALLVCTLALLIGGALVLTVISHSRSIVSDPLYLELAAGLLIGALGALCVAPLRIRILERRVERALAGSSWEPGGVVESALGSLGRAFQARFSSLRRTVDAQRASLEAYQSLVEKLLARAEGRLMILDGHGRVRYRSAAFSGTADGGNGTNSRVDAHPPLWTVVSTLVHGGNPGEVTVQGVGMQCYAVRLPHGDGGESPVAFVVLSDRPIEGVNSGPPTRSAHGQPRAGGLASVLERVFTRGRSL